MTMSLRTIADLEDQLGGREIATAGAIYELLRESSRQLRTFVRPRSRYSIGVLNCGLDDLRERCAPALRAPFQINRDARAKASACRRSASPDFVINHRRCSKRISRQPECSRFRRTSLPSTCKRMRIARTLPDVATCVSWSMIAAGYSLRMKPAGVDRGGRLFSFGDDGADLIETISRVFPARAAAS